MPKARLIQRQVSRTLLAASAAALTLALAAPTAFAERVHFTYLWHMEQPIYWPDRQVSGADRYERAWESILRKDAGRPNPTNNLRDIFGLDDRVAGYQHRMRDCINDIRWAPEAGAQISFSGGLIENLQSLGAANQLGYSPTWYSWLREARSWHIDNNPQRPRADIVIFPFHHPLMPLLEESTMRKQIQLYKSVYPDAWGASTPISKGFFPSEMAFSTRLIPVLASEGIEWSIVSAEKISRACADFPVVFGSGGINCDPPNRADQLNPAQGADAYHRVSISRGCAPAEAFPFALTPRRARYVNPDTGAISSLIVVPSPQALSWQDGYSPQGISDFQTLDARNNPSRPMLLVLAHDGDNAWGGGYSYYREATPNRVSQAQAAGFVATTVQKYLADHPVPANDFVHVEDGAWVNADSDFGSPQFWNWNWPLLNSSGQPDVENGWHVDARNWAVITATQNAVDTAEQIHTASGGSINIRRILYPDATTNNAERAWHYFMGGLNSGYMYYGTAEDFEVKPTISGNRAWEYAAPIINAAPSSGPTSDRTGPTVWIPQRWPWNPGSINFGGPYGYQQRKSNGDFYIWTFVHDVSGVQSVTLKYRIDADGVNPLSSTQNETYAGGPEVGQWISVPMNHRAFPAGNVYNDPTIDFFEMPTAIADQHWALIQGIRDQLLDYYVEAVDAKGNTTRSPIQHVYVGDGVGGLPPGPSGGGGGGSGGGGPVVALDPPSPIAGQSVIVTYNPAGRPLAGAAFVRAHVGFNNWQTVLSPDVTMTFDAQASAWSCSIVLPLSATQLDLVFNNGSGVWDNNAGADWHFAVQPASGDVSGACCIGSSCSLTTQSACAASSGAFTPSASCTANICQPPPPSFVMDGLLDPGTTLIAQNGGMWLRARLSGDVLYVACPDAGEGSDHFIFLASTPGAMRAAPWAKAGQVAGWSAFLADENDNNFVAWFDVANAAAVQSATGPNGGVLEGTINLRQQFGLAPSQLLPASIALAVGGYATQDGGALLPAAQVPAPVLSNNSIEADEYAIIQLCSLTPQGCCPGDFNADGVVDLADLLDFLAPWNANLGQSVLPGSGADTNADGVIDLADLLDFLAPWNANLGQTCP
ncbi:MAG: hypothetical protein KF768_13215 [Phycisphaeraceae bacterium]|nr:hypothetical protein [Phycisphaeraceae bacterium]